mgnify:CR=1 FL=1
MRKQDRLIRILCNKFGILNGKWYCGSETITFTFDQLCMLIGLRKIYKTYTGKPSYFLKGLQVSDEEAQKILICLRTLDLHINIFHQEDEFEVIARDRWSYRLQGYQELAVDALLNLIQEVL